LAVVSNANHHLPKGTVLRLKGVLTKDFFSKSGGERGKAVAYKDSCTAPRSSST